MMNDGLRDAFDPSSSSVGSAKKKKDRTGKTQKRAA
jgi:peptide/nickel transport system permease protein